MMINSILCKENGKTVNLTSAMLKKAISQKKVFWIDVLAPTMEDLDFLQKNLGLHRLALEDCLSFTQRPKIEQYPNHLFMVVHDLHYLDGGLIFNEVDIFLGENFLVTVHAPPVNAIEKFQQRAKEEPNSFQKGADFLQYEILNDIVDAYFPVFDDIDDSIDEIEDQVFTNPTSNTLNKTFKLKRVVLELRKTVSPQREIVNEIIRGDFPYIKKANILYYRDIYDHLIRMHDLVDTYRDLITGILDAYLSVVSNKMNEIMKVLTTIATIVMPLTLVTGLYGMNFQFMPEIHTPWGQQFGYFFALGLMLAIALIMIFFFKRKKWL
tara:strand:+ start:10285 stop:11256 length:972 start_codon:yes stop_codon:yes gene_type:complete